MGVGLQTAVEVVGPPATKTNEVGSTTIVVAVTLGYTTMLAKLFTFSTQLKGETYTVGAGDAHGCAAMAVERLGAGKSGNLAHLIYSNCCNDAVGGDAGSAGGGGVGAWLEGAALGYGDAVPVFNCSEKRMRLCYGTGVYTVPAPAMMAAAIAKYFMLSYVRAWAGIGRKTVYE